MLYGIIVYLLAALFLFFEMGIQVSPGIMTHQLMDGLQLNIFWLGLMSSAYFITYTFMQVPAGLIYDRFDTKKTLLTALLICTTGSILFALARNFYMAAGARILMGFGSAFAFIGVLVVAGRIFPARYFAFITGITQMLAALGATCGTVPLVPLLDAFGWRGTMLILSGFGATLLILILTIMRLPASTLGVNRQNMQTFFKSLTMVTRKPQSWIIAAYACLLWAPMAVVASLYGAPFIQAYFDLSPSSAAVVVTMMWIGIAIGAPLFGFLSDQTRQPRLWLIITALSGTVVFLLILLTATHHVSILILLFLLAGAACSGQALSFSLVKQATPPENQATAIGFNNMAVVVAGFIFQPLVGLIIESHASYTGTGAPHYSGIDYLYGMLVILGCYVLATLIALFGITRGQQPCSR